MRFACELAGLRCGALCVTPRHLRLFRSPVEAPHTKLALFRALGGYGFMETKTLDREPILLARLIGFEVSIDEAAGVAHCLLDVDERHLNRHGVLHGGIVATLLDTAAGVTASMVHDPQGLTPVSTVSLNINYVAPGREGPIRATGQRTGGGRSLHFVSADLCDAQGVLIASATGVFKRIGKRTEVSG